MSQANDIDKINSYIRAKRNAPDAQNTITQEVASRWDDFYKKLGWFGKHLDADKLHVANGIKETFCYSMGEEYSSYGDSLVSGFGADQMQQSFFSVGQGDYVTSAYKNLITVGRGSKGQQVAAWQTIVGVKADGDFGPATEAATKKWQAAHGLTADGVAGPQSWSAASGIVTPAVAAKLQTEAAKDVPFGVVPSNEDLGDVDAPGFLSKVDPGRIAPMAPVTTPQEAGLLASIQALPTWAKVAGGIAAVGSGLYYTPKKYGGLGK